MPDSAHSTRSDESDLAYLKRLARVGRGEPAPFLLLMAVFGGAYGFAMLIIVLGLFMDGQTGSRSYAHYEPGPLVLFGNRFALVAAHICFLAALLWTAWRTFGPNPVRLSRASAATWSAAFIGLVTTVVGFRLFTAEQSPSDSVYASYMMPPVLLVLWGSAWWITAILNDRRWLLLIAIGSFCAAILTAYVGNAGTLLPLSAACLLLLAFLPAVVLMLERRP